MAKLIKCNVCEKEITDSTKFCPNCGAKIKKPVYKKWWFWVIIIIVLIAIVSSNGDGSSSSDNSKHEKNKSVKVTVVDFSSMTEAEIDTWCEDNKINCTIKSSYSDTVAENEFVSQSVSANKTIYEGDKITITYSLGKEPSTEYKNALKTAQSYSDNMHMSKQRIYDQLVSEYGEGFEADAAQYAIDHVNADWNANALATAKSYSDLMSMSKSAIYEQLISEYGEKFTKEEAQYAIDNLGY